MEMDWTPNGPVLDFPSLSASELACAACGKRRTACWPLRRCMRCELVWYCDRQCQKKHWRWHKRQCRAVAPVALGTELMQEEAQGEVLQRGDDGGALMELDAQRETRRTTDAELLQSALSRDPASSGDADFCIPKTAIHYQTENCEATDAAGTAPPIGVGGSCCENGDMNVLSVAGGSSVGQ